MKVRWFHLEDWFGTCFIFLYIYFYTKEKIFRVWYLDRVGCRAARKLRKRRGKRRRRRGIAAVAAALVSRFRIIIVSFGRNTYQCEDPYSVSMSIHRTLSSLDTLTHTPISLLKAHWSISLPPLPSLLSSLSLSLSHSTPHQRDSLLSSNCFLDFLKEWLLYFFFSLNEKKDKEADHYLMNPSETSAIPQSHSLFPTHDTSNSLHFSLF